jgi:hypothetical protein
MFRKLLLMSQIALKQFEFIYFIYSQENMIAMLFQKNLEIWNKLFKSRNQRILNCIIIILDYLLELAVEEKKFWLKQRIFWIKQFSFNQKIVIITQNWDINCVSVDFTMRLLPLINLLILITRQTLILFMEWFIVKFDKIKLTKQRIKSI